MLSKCANAACSARFRYLHQGRIFNLEVSSLSSNNSGQVGCKIEHFWLCDSCATVMKVVWENGTVNTRPLYSPPADSRSKPGRDHSRRAALAVGASS
jgi:hypothetical protein